MSPADDNTPDASSGGHADKVPRKQGRRIRRNPRWKPEKEDDTPSPAKPALRLSQQEVPEIEAVNAHPDIAYSHKKYDISIPMPISQQDIDLANRVADAVLAAKQQKMGTKRGYSAQSEMFNPAADEYMFTSDRTVRITPESRPALIQAEHDLVQDYVLCLMGHPQNKVGLKETRHTLACLYTKPENPSTISAAGSRVLVERLERFTRKYLNQHPEHGVSTTEHTVW